MKVLFVYKYLTVGGVEAVLRTRLRGLNDLGITAHAWFLMDCGGARLFADQRDRLHIGTVEELEDYLLQEPFDVISSIDTPEIFPLWREPPPSTTLVVEVHTTYAENLRYLDDLHQFPVASVLVPSRAQADLVEARLETPLPIEVVSNPLAFEFLGPICAPATPPSRPIVAWIGRLDEHKNWRAALKVVAGLEDLDVELTVVGGSAHPEGPEMLRKEASKRGLERSLRWLPGVDHKVVARLLDVVRCSGGTLLVTSKAESFGMTVIEAMARGCPVVAPDRGPFNELVQDEAGLLYEDSIESAVLSIRRLLNDQALHARLSRQARQLALDRFAPLRSLPRLERRLRKIHLSASTV